MRISDWSSDVCSSDLAPSVTAILHRRLHGRRHQSRVPDLLPRKSGAARRPESAKMLQLPRPKRPAEGGLPGPFPRHDQDRSEEHTSELQSLMRISYAVLCLKKQKTHTHIAIRLPCKKNTQYH